MHRFTCDIRSLRVRSKELKQTGELTLRTNLEIRGNYRVANVPVTVTYEACFLPDREFWDGDAMDPDHQFPVYYSKQFDTAEERETYCRIFYETLPTADA